MRTLRALGAVAAVTLLTLLGGCSAPEAGAPAGGVAGGADPADGSAGDRAEYEAPVPQGGPGEVPGATLTPKLARTARVSLTVTDVERAAAQLRDLARSVNGQVTAENLVTAEAGQEPSSPGPTSTIVITVPADRLDSTLDQLKSVGPVTARVVSSEDVTTQVADVDSRITTLNASIDRLRELWRQAGGVRELSELEAQLTARLSERDSLVAQQKALEGRVATSPITITLNTPPPPGQLETSGFLGGLAAGWNALVSSSRVLLTVLGAVLPFAVLLALVALPVLWWRRRVRRLRTPAPVPPPAPDAPADQGAPRP